MDYERIPMHDVDDGILLDKASQYYGVAPHEVSLVEVSLVEVSPVGVSPVEVSPVELPPVDEVSPVEVSPVELAPVELAPVELSPVEVSPVEVSLHEVPSVEVSPVKVSLHAISPVNTSPSLHEVSPHEVLQDKVSEKDGGRSGWIAVFSLWMQAFIWTGFFKGLGLMLPILQQQFDTNGAIIGWMVGMIGAMIGFVGPFSGAIGRTFGTGVVYIICGTAVGFSAILASITAYALQMAIILTLFLGPSLGIPDILLKEAVGRRFDKNYVTALCIGKTGTSFGMLLLTPLSQLFLDAYGWRGTLLLLGGLSFHLTVCGALMITTDDKTLQTTSRTAHITLQNLTANTSSRDRCSAVWKSAVQNLDVKLLLNLRYWSVTFMLCCSQLSFDMWIVYFVSMVQTKGFSAEDAATFVTVAGVGHLLARASQGFILDRWVKSYSIPMAILFSTAGAMFFATPWLNLYWELMLSAVLVLFSVGAVLCLFEVLFKQILGVELLTGALGWAGITIAVLRFTLVFIPGLMYDLSGSYNGAFIFLGVMQSLCLIPLGCLKYFKIIQ
ncbi:monocarboxylate transporter 13-like [Asterias amurensis]|uniref:monocarboxylate transporter 13-like n=1 Tax=Asterias amurensis TaxID=7602 RepID=UPI003AB78ABB